MSEWKKVRLGEIANYVNEKIDIKAFDLKSATTRLI